MESGLADEGSRRAKTLAQYMEALRAGYGGRVRRGQGDALDGEWNTEDDDADVPRRATRERQNLIVEGDSRLQDEAVREMGGSPVREEKG